MQSQTRGTYGRQITLAEHAPRRESVVPNVRPTADAELEEIFTRAAAAWARWKDRSLWEGR